MFHPQGPTFWELAQQALSSTRRGYDLLATKFDYTPFRTPDDILAAAVRYLGESGTIDSALDVCCGTGAAIPMLRSACRRRVVGIDFSANMLRVGRQSNENTPGTAELNWVQADVLDMPFESEFDVATCFGALGHIPAVDQSRFVEQIAKALRPRGRFIFASSCTPSWWSRRYWLSRGFNGAMHVRNFLVRPHFVMFYLTFLVPEASILLKEHGFHVEVHEGLFAANLADACLVIATLENR